MNEKTKLQKTSNSIVNICNFILGLLALGGAALTAGIPVVLFTELEKIQNTFYYYAFNGVKVNAPVNLNKPALLIGLAIGLVGILLFIGQIFYTRKIFKNVSASHTPFTLENSVYIKRIAGFVAATAIAQPIGLLLFGFALKHAEIEVGVGLDMLVVAFIIYAISLVFEHGVTLQQQADETL